MFAKMVNLKWIICFLFVFSYEFKGIFNLLLVGSQNTMRENELLCNMHTRFECKCININAVQCQSYENCCTVKDCCAKKYKTPPGALLSLNFNYTSGDFAVQDFEKQLLSFLHKSFNDFCDSTRNIWQSAHCEDPIEVFSKEQLYVNSIDIYDDNISATVFVHRKKPVSSFKNNIEDFLPVTHVKKILERRKDRLEEELNLKVLSFKTFNVEEPDHLQRGIIAAGVLGGFLFIVCSSSVLKAFRDRAAIIKRNAERRNRRLCKQFEQVAPMEASDLKYDNQQKVETSPTSTAELSKIELQPKDKIPNGNQNVTAAMVHTNMLSTNLKQNGAVNPVFSNSENEEKNSVSTPNGRDIPAGGIELVAPSKTEIPTKYTHEQNVTEKDKMD